MSFILQNMSDILTIAITAFISAILSMTVVMLINREGFRKDASKKKIGTSLRPLTFRISGISRNITKKEFQIIFLANLPSELSTTSPHGASDQLELLGWSFAPTAAVAQSDRSFV